METLPLVFAFRTAQLAVFLTPPMVMSWARPIPPTPSHAVGSSRMPSPSCTPPQLHVAPVPTLDLMTLLAKKGVMSATALQPANTSQVLMVVTVIVLVVPTARLHPSPRLSTLPRGIAAISTFLG